MRAKESLAATLPRVEKLKQLAADHRMTLTDFASSFRSRRSRRRFQGCAGNNTSP